MNAIIALYSSKENEICNFLNSFYKNNLFNCKTLKWEKEYSNPVEIADIIGVFIDNIDKYSINMWISLDNDFFINITEHNANKIIKYLFERYPY